MSEPNEVASPVATADTGASSSSDATTTTPPSDPPPEIADTYNCPRLVLRLLQLIRQSSSSTSTTTHNDSSSSSANRIVDHLIDVVQQHMDKQDEQESLYMLWDILGRLLGILLMKQNNNNNDNINSCSACWKSRTLAGQAVHGIAKLLPQREKERFLEESAASSRILLDLATLQRVLAKAKPLLARNDEDDDDDNESDGEEDYSLDGLDPSSPDFVQKRLALQRRILHRRLGLSLLTAVGGTTDDGGDGDDTTTAAGDIISQDDLFVPASCSNASASSTLLEPPTKRQRRLPILDNDNNNVDDDDDDEDNHPHSLRSLILLQFQKQQQQQQQFNSISSSRTTHHDDTTNNINPQEVVSHELLLHMLDPSWQVRHGALIGILALLRACWWNNNDDALDVLRQQRYNSIDDNSLPCSSSSSWPRTVLSLSLLVLATDRFGDYSGCIGGSIIGNNSTNSVISGSSNSTVAPVREMAGQVVAIIWMRASQQQEETLTWLLDVLLTSPEWEARHGGLTACKFMTALVLHYQQQQQQHPCHDDKNNNNADVSSYLVRAVERMAQAAMQALSDKSDDVKSVAAQLLLQYYNYKIVPAVGDDASMLVYNSITQAKTHSACLIDLVALLAVMVKQQQQQQQQQCGTSNIQTIAHSHVLDTLIRLLDSDFSSVQQSALLCLQKLASPIATNAVGVVVESNTRSTITTTANSSCAAFGRVVERLFELYFSNGDTDDNNDDNDVLVDSSPDTRQTSTSRFDDDTARIRIARDNAWQEVARASQIVYSSASGGDAWKALELHLICRYFEINQHQQRRRPTSANESNNFRIQSGAARALAILFFQNNAINRRPLLEIALESFLQSPWATKCEAACLLLREILLLYPSSTTNHNKPLLLSSELLTSLRDMLGTRCPPCLAFNTTAAAWDAPDHDRMAGVCDQAFCFAVSNLDDTKATTLTTKRTVVYQRVHSIVQIWLKALGPEVQHVGEKMTSSVLSMRVNATIVGSVLADALPSKLTPLIRALITSLKNEESRCRLNRTCLYLCELLLAIQDRPEFAVANRKVLDTICEMAMDESSESDSSSRMNSPGTNVLRLFIGRMAPERALKDLQPLWVHIEPLLVDNVVGDNENDNETLVRSIHLLQIIGVGNDFGGTATSDFVAPLTKLACCSQNIKVRMSCFSAIKSLCSVNRKCLLRQALVNMQPHLKNPMSDLTRLNACSLLEALVVATGVDISPFVRALLPVVMSLMTDPVEDCAWSANKIFAVLVQVAPLVQQQQSIPLDSSASQDDSVIDHLILGKPLPDTPYPKVIEESLIKAGIVLRHYQREGISWLRFLMAVNLNGALCDSMGLGKTLQALIGIALSHNEAASGFASPNVKSLIVCPSTLVAHWRAEIDKFFPGAISNIFSPMSFNGNRVQRTTTWGEVFASSNIVITSYSVLRCEVDLLCGQDWRYCVLDEGHLLSNPKTATARASRRLKARHKLILTGTPIQNKVTDLYATFDFLMPNFLGSSSGFAKEYARPISKSQLPGATASAIGEGIEKLKSLHQQVLPFILRREKHEVLKELPPKIVSVIKVPMSILQSRIYSSFCSSESSRASLENLRRVLQASQSTRDGDLTIGADALRSLLFLRLLCTHPSLVAETSEIDNKCSEEWYKLGSSGKLLALLEILRSAGINEDSITAADNDTSLLYCDGMGDENHQDSYSKVVSSTEDSGLGPETHISTPSRGRKCVIFAQFTKSLDVVEKLVFKPHMPSLRYLRLDGRVPTGRRAEIASKFNSNHTIRVLLATTRVGGLGLNLTGADMVLFLENDFNPFADLQAMDRLHRIGQTRSVNVYNFVTENSIEERIMDLQEKKVAVSDAIVNTENSSMYSMGTDRLLDIFAFRTSQEAGKGNDKVSCIDLDALLERYNEDYESLSVGNFLKSYCS